VFVTVVLCEADCVGVGVRVLVSDSVLVGVKLGVPVVVSVGV
jgi:hypothetical protein